MAEEKNILSEEQLKEISGGAGDGGNDNAKHTKITCWCPHCNKETQHTFFSDGGICDICFKRAR